jgi:hypothetical protein
MPYAPSALSLGNTYLYPELLSEEEIGVRLAAHPGTVWA